MSKRAMFELQMCTLGFSVTLKCLVLFLEFCIGSFMSAQGEQTLYLVQILYWTITAFVGWVRLGLDP